MAAYRWVYDSRHLQADCQEPGSAPEPYAWQSTMGYLYLLGFSAYLCICTLHVPACRRFYAFYSHVRLMMLRTLGTKPFF